MSQSRIRNGTKISVGDRFQHRKREDRLIVITDFGEPYVEKDAAGAPIPDTGYHVHYRLISKTTGATKNGGHISVDRLLTDYDAVRRQVMLSRDPQGRFILVYCDYDGTADYGRDRPIQPEEHEKVAYMFGWDGIWPQWAADYLNRSISRLADDPGYFTDGAEKGEVA